MATLTFGQITETVLAPLKPPRRLYYGVLAVLAFVIAWAAACWVYQVKMGMGVTGLSIPVGWAVYITNFVFWIGIGHAGTLISAILHLVRARWRTAISRSAEAMTIFAVMTAGLFPLIHLGRVWVFFYIIPYPSERQLWPNFLSPLVWDVCAVSTYLTVSIIFWYIGIIPDLAAARDRWELTAGADHPRTRLYRAFALGWSGSGNQWRHHGRGYLFFAALATPLVISVHSVVSWDFAMANLPGWHTTIFAPYFVAGAIHSGLAMVLTLLIPMRRLLRLERVMTVDHFEAVAQTMIVTALIVGYAYAIEPFISWYSGDLVRAAVRLLARHRLDRAAVLGAAGLQRPRAAGVPVEAPAAEHPGAAGRLDPRQHRHVARTAGDHRRLDLARLPAAQLARVRAAAGGDLHHARLVRVLPLLFLHFHAGWRRRSRSAT